VRGGLLLTCRNYPAQHFEMNEAWILSDSTETSASAHGTGEPLRSRETYPNGKLRASWSGRADLSGHYLMAGVETQYYRDGARQYEATWNDGIKTGLETFWGRDGKPVWQWEHRTDGISVWTQFWPGGQKRRQSSWRGFRCEGKAGAWDETGRPTESHEFRNGTMVR